MFHIQSCAIASGVMALVVQSLGRTLSRAEMELLFSKACIKNYGSGKNNLVGWGILSGLETVETALKIFR